ncbi:hypothetical protein [Hymenobacter psychrophilus]|uniref:Uncharacterized protein n=1 Tax=Hymenobacter psychrophilus TaxID=651662 RepID=A0A1H3HTK9_9BACT|nr:hypothetical protein [Hymenobacter psychrophilus]SDY18861.1 hypothetical protein SAMN04488069_106148 [Hymenobacter psychrophilus]
MKAGTGPDVIVLLNGDELPAQVVRIIPDVVRYLPPPAVDNSPADTLQLAAAKVLLIRYSDGTQKLLRPAEDSASAVPALAGLSRGQRYERGRQDARLYYQPAKGVFWGTFASTAAAGPAGLIVGTAVAATGPPRQSLKTSNPALLTDPTYYAGYQRQAHNRKVGVAAAGLVAGSVMFAVVAIVVATIALR